MDRAVNLNVKESRLGAWNVQENAFVCPWHGHRLLCNSGPQPRVKFCESTVLPESLSQPIVMWVFGSASAERSGRKEAADVLSSTVLDNFRLPVLVAGAAPCIAYPDRPATLPLLNEPAPAMGPFRFSSAFPGSDAGTNSRPRFPTGHHSG
jgi:hypothetical protein